MASNHSLPLIAIAISTCTISSWLFFQLTKRATAVNRREKLSWMLLATIVIGFGVWATQFIATLGYRPDLDFSFDVNLTVISAVLGILLVGAPATAAIVSGQTVGAALGGFIAGLGVSAMHRAGMGSIIDLHFHHDMLVMLATALAGSLVFALALIFAIRGRTHIATVLLVLAVCVIHFSATAISTVEVLSPAETDGIGQTMLGGIVGTIAICLLLAAAVFVSSSTRVAEQERQRALMATALDNMSNGLVSINHDGRIELFNRRLVSLFGLAPDDVSIGMRWQSFLSNLASILGWNDARLSRIIANHKLWFARKETTYLEHALDDGRTISVACRPIGNGGAVLTYDDVTAERLAQREIERLAFQDPLTALPNRRSFQRTLEAILESPASVTLMLIDLDRFKVINDTLGHSAGDELLIEVGKRISKLCKRGEFVARLAGDEFAVIATECPPDDATSLSDAIVSSLGSPFSVDGYAVVSGCSIGIASTAEAGTGAMLVQHADLALYKAKAMGRGMSRHYEQGMQEAASQRLRLEADLRVALLEGQFELAFQPIFRLDDLRLIGFEALIRWAHPEHGVISPSVFIPVAEETGLIRDIGFWVLNESCRQVARWPSDVYVAVNVSPVQLRSDVFPLQLASALTSFDIAPSRLEVELTETALVSDSEQIAASLRSLRKMGIRVAMDDFGTGYSSFAHLRDFALDWIKIDKSFVQIAPTDASAAAVVSSVVHMAKGLGVGTIAEGVETQEQLDFLRQIGCSAAQGYLLARPMSAAEAALASVTATR